MFRQNVIAGTVFFMMLTSVTVWAHHPSGGAGITQTGPVMTISATTMQQGKFSFGLQSEFIKLDSFPDSTMRRYAEQGYDVHTADSVNHHFLSFAFGVTDNLTLALKVPYEQVNNIREAHADEAAEIHKHGDAKGLGDMSLLGQYRFLKLDNKLESAALFGLKMPTGKTNDKDIHGETFEAEFLPGTGAWHPILGVAVTKRLPSLVLDANLLYTFSTEGTQDTDLGDILNYNAALSYRPVRGNFSWDLILELNGEWKEKEKIHGKKDRDSGGNIVFLSPGTRISMGNRLSAYLSLGIPILQDLNGIQNDTDYKAVGGISMQF